jgi:hypothetical protein
MGYGQSTSFQIFCGWLDVSIVGRCVPILGRFDYSRLERLQVQNSGNFREKVKCDSGRRLEDARRYSFRSRYSSGSSLISDVDLANVRSFGETRRLLKHQKTSSSNRYSTSLGLTDIPFYLNFRKSTETEHAKLYTPMNMSSRRTARDVVAVLAWSLYVSFCLVV